MEVKSKGPSRQLSNIQILSNIITAQVSLLQVNLAADTLLSTHVQLTSSACASPTDESVSEAIQ